MEILVLSKEDCPYCELTKSFLSNQDVEYRVVNVTEQPEYAEQYDIMSVPVTLLLDEDEEIIRSSGFNPSVLNSMIQQL